MILKQRIDAFVKVGLFINRHFNLRDEAEEALHDGLDKVIELSYLYNGWFTPNFVKHAIKNIGTMLAEKDLVEFCDGKETKSPKKVAVICAGNIPMVGFHDIMCVLLSGHNALIKLSSDDNVLLPFFIKLLTHYEPDFEQALHFADGRLGAFDAVIATGSNNTAMHFHQYFGKYPHIIRKNRTSVAVLNGKESEADLKLLGEDIFLYFGLGCRNVSKLLVPENYNFNNLFEAIVDFGYVIDNKKYGNNYDYHRAIYLLEQYKFLDNNFLMIRESDELHSPVGVLYFSYYREKEEAENYLTQNKEAIQCVVGAGRIPFGYSQRPVITDFADNVNTLKFLVTL
ncbi:MAG: acyl-CoA reductase [Bacteroidetes bacterium]|nr:acyl-CoA reductase [Bacteroidota bacterium]